MYYAVGNSQKLEFSRALPFPHSLSISISLSPALSWCPPSNPALAIIYLVYLLSGLVIRGSNVFISEIGREDSFFLLASNYPRGG